jgi:hypothetical protein
VGATWMFLLLLDGYGGDAGPLPVRRRFQASMHRFHSSVDKGHEPPGACHIYARSVARGHCETSP